MTAQSQPIYVPAMGGWDLLNVLATGMGGKLPFARYCQTMLRNAAAVFIALILISCSKPVRRLNDLDGCYEAEGLPDFMRPPVHWALRISGGSVFDRSGKLVSRVRLSGRASSMTALTFSPGIVVTDDEHKETTVVAGETVSGTAYLLKRRPIIRLRDDSGTMMQKTSCGPTSNA